MAGLRTVRVFVSSPGDVELERRRVDVVSERLNALYPNVVRIEVIRWETKFYTADKSFQVQIPEARDCDIVIGIFWARLGSVLPPAFPKMPDGTPYPSGTAYEVLSAIEKKREQEKIKGEAGAAPDQPGTDVYIFQKKAPPFPAPRDENELALFDTQWKLLKGFFERWFRSSEGQFLAAFHGFSTTDQFEEQVEKLLQNWLAEHVLKTRALTWPVATLGSPFRGLDQFDAWHAPVFFGRTADIVRATDRLKAAARAGFENADGDHDATDEAGDAHDKAEAAKSKCAYLLVVGASGCGKSSFVHAGIVPRLVTPGFVREVDGWRVAIMGKGTESSPFESLAQALFSQGTQNPTENGSPYSALPELAEGDHSTPAELAALWRDGSLTSKPVERALDRACAALQAVHKSEKPPQVDLVLVVDQLDDLFVSDQAKHQRSQFAALLAKLAATGRVWIVTTLRASLYEQYLSDAAFKALKDDGAYYDLAAPGRGELAEIVRKPAEAAQLLFEKNEAGVGLDEKLLADAADPDTLPLLQFTLQMLFKSRREIEGQSWLTFEAYSALGGVDGAIDRTAEAALETLEKAEQDSLPRLLRQLVKSAGYSSMASGRMAMVVRTVPLASAERTEAAKKLVQALVGARILTLEQDDRVATIRVTHQRALESWKRARGLVEADADFHRILGEVNDQYTRWNRNGRKRELLLPKGLPLAEAESIVARFGDEVPTELQQYIRISGRWARLRQRLIALSAMVFAGVAMAAIFYWHQAQKSLVAATGAIGALVQGISEVVRPLAQLDTVEQLVTQARIAINQFDGASRDDAIRTQQGRTYLLLADIDLDRGDVKQMRSDAQQAFGLLDQLSSDGNPETRLFRADSERFIGLSYFESSDRENARKQYEQGIGDLKKLLDLNLNPDLLWHVRRSLANLYQEEGDVLLFKYSLPTEALGAFDQCLDLRGLLARTGHTGPAFSHDIAWALNKHGDVQVKLGNDDAALQWFTRAKDGLDALGDHLWDNVVWAFDLALVYNNIGLIQLRAGKFEQAIAAFDQAEPIIKRVVEYDPQNLSRRSALSWTSFNRSDALFRLARETKDLDRLRQAREGFVESNNSTRKDAEQATLVSRVQLGLWRGQAYLAAIDATMIDWSGDHLRAAEGFGTAAKIIIDEYLPHADEFPRRDYIAEGCEYLEWAGNAYLDGGATADGRRLLQQALDMAKQYRSILGDGAFTPLQARIEGELARAN